MLIAFLSAVLAVAPVAAQDPAAVIDPTAVSVPTLDPTVEPGAGTQRRVGRKVTPLVAPLPFRNSQIGWGGAVMVGLIHRFDPDTTIKPSTGAISGLASENGTWGVMAFEAARFKRDTWRVRGMAGYLFLRYDFYGIGIDEGNAGFSIPIEQGIFVAAAVGLRRVVGNLYLGGSLVWLETRVDLRDSVGGPTLPDQGLGSLFAPGLHAEYDDTDSDYWPIRGSLAELKVRLFSTQSGESGTFQRYTVSWSWYKGLRGRDLVLATNINSCFAPGDAPFYGLCSLGSGRYTLRGYTQGRYRDHVGNVVQAELRGHSKGRLGAVVFGGFGQVSPDAAGIFSSELLVAGGVGLRLQLTKEFPVHGRLDYAWGRDGGELYVSVGEAF